MSNTKRIKVLNYRNANGLAPNPDNIDYGEIAIGYKKDNEAIYIKTTANDIVDFTPISIVNITYNKLKELRDNSKLKPSQYYRITDFVTTVANDLEAQSAGHPFDIIVMASKENKLQEECYAIQHEGDTYFDNCNLAAWKIWYCLDNDNTKYAWADTTEGKGVIYRMIDEWQNDCPYDFKNVQFKRYAVANVSSDGELADLNGRYIGYNAVMTGLSIPDPDNFIWAYTFSIGEQIGEPGDASIIGYNSYHVGGCYGQKGYYGDNTIKSSSSRSLIDDVVYSVFCLNNIVWWTNNTINRGAINGNRIESECSNMTLSGYGTIIEHDCFNLIMGSQCYGNSFKTGCSCNSFGNACSNNSFGNDCNNNTFGNWCVGNTFENRCGDNTFENDCNNNTFGNDCNNNTFGNSCYSNTFGNSCDDNTFGNDCNYNSFRVTCYGNTFKYSCNYNSFGSNCYGNSFGNYFQYNALGNDIVYIEIPTEKIYHTQILNGTKGTYANKLTIEFTPETTYSQFAGFTSDGVLKIWVEADDIVNITYNELKELRNNSKLKPSQYYRITDFVTTVDVNKVTEARSAGHRFDIIVMASKENKLQEECYAIQHEGETYFDNCNLAAWKIWYCLDNDSTKYAWADTANGKGVIYRMIDEWQNDCPYDFKNVQFKRYYTNGLQNGDDVIAKGYFAIDNNINIFPEGAVDTSNPLYFYTFTRLNGIIYGYGKGDVTQDNVLDESIQTLEFSTDTYTRCQNNVLGHMKSTSHILTNNVFLTISTYNEEVGSYYLPSYGNKIGLNCSNNTFGSDVYGLTFGDGCSDNIIGDDCYYNTFGNRCSSNTFGNSCYSNTFGNSCYSNTFGNNCHNNSFGNGCAYNTFRNSCYSNTLGNECNGNTFGESCGSNTFGENCYSNTFGYDCVYNSFENGCNTNSFGNSCYYNSFGNSCGYNTFENGCGSNSFGNDCGSNKFSGNCYNNSFGNDCSNNTLGDSCYSNTFGNKFHHNTFGNDCNSNSFGNDCISNSFGNYFQYNALGNDIQYIEIPTEKIYHTQILNGTKGTYDNKLTLEFTPETKYSQFAGFTSDNVLETWVEADAPHDVVDGGSY